MLKKLGNCFIIGFLYLWSRLGLTNAQRLGWLLGHLIACFKTDMKRIVQINLDLCFPELSKYHKKKLIRKIICHTVITGAEMPVILFQKPNKLLKSLHTVYGKETIQNLYNQERGVMVLGLHLGSYELGSMYFPQNFPSAMLYTPPKIELLDKLIYNARSRLCENMSPANHKGVKMLFKAMAKHQVTAMLVDQVPTGSGSTYVDFFAIPAKTMDFPWKIYQRFNPAIIAGYVVRNKVGKGYTLVLEDLEPAIKAAQTQTDIEDPVAYAFTKHFEKVIRKYPEQYQWTYKRFKHNPQDIDFYKKDKK